MGSILSGQHWAVVSWLLSGSHDGSPAHRATLYRFLPNLAMGEFGTSAYRRQHILLGDRKLCCCTAGRRGVPANVSARISCGIGAKWSEVSPIHRGLRLGSFGLWIYGRRLSEQKHCPEPYFSKECNDNHLIGSKGTANQTVWMHIRRHMA